MISWSLRTAGREDCYESRSLNKIVMGKRLNGKRTSKDLEGRKIMHYDDENNSLNEHTTGEHDKKPI